MHASSDLSAFWGHGEKIRMKSSLISALLHKIYNPAEANVDTDFSSSDTLHLIAVRSCQCTTIFYRGEQGGRAGDRIKKQILLRISLLHLGNSGRLFRNQQQNTGNYSSKEVA